MTWIQAVKGDLELKGILHWKQLAKIETTMQSNHESLRFSGHKCFFLSLSL